MSEFDVVRTKVDLETLDEDQIVAGYRAGMSGVTSLPGSDKCRGYWHGWRNAMIDRGHHRADDASTQLAREVVGLYRGLN